jgi:hypothetical protein
LVYGIGEDLPIGELMFGLIDLPCAGKAPDIVMSARHDQLLWA